MWTVAVALAPAGSVTFKRASNSPVLVYECDGSFEVLWDVPSPKSQSYLSVPPSGSLEPEPLSLTVSGGAPDVGVASATAIGDLLLGT